MRNAFGSTVITRIEPVIDLKRNVTVIGTVCTNAYKTVAKLGQVPKDTLDSFEMAFAGTSTKSRKSHDVRRNIKTVNLYCPL